MNGWPDNRDKTVRAVTNWAARTAQFSVSVRLDRPQNQRTMIHRRRPTAYNPSPASGREWQPTEAGALMPEPAGRRQPPLREVLKGLDARELEGETVFDQLFGPAAEN